MDTPENPRRYLAVAGLTLAGFAALLATFNIGVDAFDVFGTLRGQPVPVRLTTSVRTAKAYALRQAQADCLVLGTSRADYGLRATAMGADCRAPYDAAIPLANIYENRRYLEHALAQGPVRRVFVALEEVMFRDAPLINEDYDEARLSVHSGGEPATYPYNELTGLALGYDALMRNVRMLRKPREPVITAKGERVPEMLEAELVKISVNRAAREQFVYLGTVMGAPTAFPAEGSLTRGLAELDRILALCREHGIELRLAFSPIHADFHAMLMDLGLHGEFLRWKREVIARADAARAAGSNVELWDFAQINAVTTEPVPARGDREGRMQWYWESTHFKPALGDLVMDQVYGRAPAEPSFGLKVSGTNAAEVERQYLADLDAWCRQHPDDLREVQNWLASVRLHYRLKSGLEPLLR